MTTKAEERAAQVAAESATAADIEREYRDRAVEFSAEIEALSPNVGQLVLEARIAGESDPTAAITERINVLRSARDAAEQTASAAFDRRCDLWFEERKLEAAGLRRQAAAKRREAAKHSVRTTELLGELQAHEGVEYVPFKPEWSGPASAGLKGGAPTVVTVVVPRSEWLRVEATQLDEEADRIEQRTIPSSGRVVADSVAELLEKVHDLGLVRVPDDGAIRAWAETVGSAHRETLARVEAHDVRYGGLVRYTLSWVADTIDRSSGVRLVEVPELVAEEVDRRQDSWSDRRQERIAERARVIAQAHDGFSADDARQRAISELKPELLRIEREEREAIADEIRRASTET